MNVSKQKQTHIYREDTSSYQYRDRKGEGNLRVGDQQAQAIMYKITILTRIYYTVQGI